MTQRTKPYLISAIIAAALSAFPASADARDHGDDAPLYRSRVRSRTLICMVTIEGQRRTTRCYSAGSRWGRTRTGRWQRIERDDNDVSWRGRHILGGRDLPVDPQDDDDDDSGRVSVPRLPAPDSPESPVPSTVLTNNACGSLGESEAVRLANVARRNKGLAPLRCESRLIAAARAHSQDMCSRGFFSHQNPDGEQPWDRLKKAGAKFKAAGENIAAGYSSGQSVHDGWMNSAGHRANILKSTYSRVGVGLVQCDNGSAYWTQLFAR